MKIGLALGGGDGESLDQAVDRIVTAERDGFAAAWLANIFSLDALTVLALAGQKTERIELGTAVVPTYPRHPHALAQQAATVGVATGGRLALGIGRSHQVVIETMFGLSYDSPITHMREYITALKQLMNDGRCELAGKLYNINAPLTIKEPAPPGIFVGALMPKMLRLCGQLCEGTLTWMSGPGYISKTIVPEMRKAAEESGREMPRVVCSLPVCVTDDVDEAKKTAAKLFVTYGQLPVYRACLDAEGAEGPADIALIGDEATVKAGLERAADAGASDFYAAVFPAGRDREASMQRSYECLAGLGGKV